MMLRNYRNENWSSSGGEELTKEDKRVSSRKFPKKESTLPCRDATDVRVSPPFECVLKDFERPSRKAFQASL